MSSPISLIDIKSVLWKALELSRGAIGQRDNLHYVIVLLFLKYVTDSKNAVRKQDERGTTSSSNAIEQFQLPPHADFWTLHERCHEPGNSSRLNNVLLKIEDANPTLRGILTSIYPFHTSSKGDGVADKILSHLLIHFAGFDLHPTASYERHIVGDAFDYLIEIYATNYERQIDNFYTPGQISEMLARVLNPQANDNVYDPVCGTGGMLLRCAQHIRKKDAGSTYVLYGQEKSMSTLALANLNMFFHDEVNCQLVQADALHGPHVRDSAGWSKQFDVVLGNPPYSMPWDADAARHDTGRCFWRGIPPKSRADYAFILHMIESLKPNTGRMATIMPHGVLSRGGIEGEIRKQLVEENLLDAVIGLPPKLFSHTTIPVVILIFRMDKVDDSVMFIDASSYFDASKIQNTLAQAHIDRIVDTYIARLPIDGYAHISSLAEIRKCDYNLSIPRYITAPQLEEEIDISSIRAERMARQTELAEVESRLNAYLKKVEVMCTQKP